MKKKRRSQNLGKNQKRSKLDQYFTLDWKEIYLLVIAWFLFLVLHNLVNNIFGINEKILLVIAIKVVPLFFALALVYTFAKKLRKGV